MGVFRPATAISILLLAAFVLLLLSVLSAPIVESITIASYKGVKFGVFGYCSDSKGCGSVGIGYNMDNAMDNAQNDWKLPSNARNSLTNLLIVHPIAALLTLIQFVMSVLAHLHGPAHSPKYLLALLIFALPTFVCALLAILVDILIFLPHVEWGGWVVLAATVLIAFAGIATCGIRRQVVGRIARNKRIQENAEMNGDAYNTQRVALNNAINAEPTDKLPEFATFEVNKGGSSQSGAMEGERIPLRSRTASPPVDDPGFGRSNTINSDRSGSYGPPPRGNGPLGSGPNPMGGNGLPPMRNQYSNQTLHSNGSGQGPYGPQQPMPMRGAYGPPPDRGFRGPPGPPGGYDGAPGPRYGPGPGYRGPSPVGAYGPGPGQGPRRGPPPGPGMYGPGPGLGPMRGPSPGAYGPPNNGYGPNRGPPPGSMGGMPPVGMAMGMGPRRGPPPQDRYHDEDMPAHFDNNARDERGEFDKTTNVPGAFPTDNMIGVARSDNGFDDANRYPHSMLPELAGSHAKLPVLNESRAATPQAAQLEGDDTYIPPRAQWEQDQQNNQSQHLQQPSAIELPTSTTPSGESPPTLTTTTSNTYYEDVQPQFDRPIQTPPPLTSSPHPPALMPAGGTHSPVQNMSQWQPPPPPIPNEDPPMSPGAMSSASGFTSVSQRGVNPRWQEEQGRLAAQSQGMGRKSAGLTGNPDFDMSAVRRGGAAGFR
ncbi:pali-domain-containing protein [Ascodesmis nigricans]|uniref:Pali-domain-containing protein n=1 Tax=Ascodesmis nigricans TaxID=341454 RepID=A0A4S2MVC1_9PEZI|nr:pali-domain-containing protein [Ascodesmis nigricans]